MDYTAGERAAISTQRAGPNSLEVTLLWLVGMGSPTSGAMRLCCARVALCKQQVKNTGEKNQVSAERGGASRAVMMSRGHVARRSTGYLFNIAEPNFRES